MFKPGLGLKDQFFVIYKECNPCKHQRNLAFCSGKLFKLVKSLSIEDAFCPMNCSNLSSCDSRFVSNFTKKRSLFYKHAEACFLPQTSKIKPFYVKKDC